MWCEIKAYNSEVSCSFHRPLHLVVFYLKHFLLMLAVHRPFLDGHAATLDVRRKFRSQTSNNMDKWKSRGGKSQRGEEKKREDQRGERVRRKKMRVGEKVGKSRFTVFYQWFVAPARNKFASEKARNSSHSGRFWNLRCPKSARRCSAKHMSEKRCTKRTNIGPLLEVEMSQKCAPLWREARFQVKSAKTDGYGPGALLDVQMSFRVAGGRDYAPCQKWGKCEGCVTVSTITATLHSTTLRYTTVHSTTLHYTTLNHTTLHTLHYSTLQVQVQPPLHYTTLDHTTPHHTTPHHTTPHHTTLQQQLLLQIQIWLQLHYASYNYN